MLGQLETDAICRIPRISSARSETRSVFTRTSVPRRPELHACSRNVYHSHLKLSKPGFRSHQVTSGKSVGKACSHCRNWIKHWSLATSTHHHPHIILQCHYHWIILKASENSGTRPIPSGLKVLMTIHLYPCKPWMEPLIPPVAENCVMNVFF